MDEGGAAFNQGRVVGASHKVMQWVVNACGDAVVVRREAPLASTQVARASLATVWMLVHRPDASTQTLS